MPGMEHPAAMPPDELGGTPARLAENPDWVAIYVGDNHLVAEHVAADHGDARIEAHDGFTFVFVRADSL